MRISASIQAANQLNLLSHIDSNNKNSTYMSEDDHTSCLEGYVTISPITMSIRKEPNFEKLKKVNF